MAAGRGGTITRLQAIAEPHEGQRLKVSYFLQSREFSELDTGSTICRGLERGNILQQAPQQPRAYPATSPIWILVSALTGRLFAKRSVPALRQQLEDGLKQGHAGAQGLTGLLTKRVPRPGSGDNSAPGADRWPQPLENFTPSGHRNPGFSSRPDNMLRTQGEGCLPGAALLFKGRVLSGQDPVPVDFSPVRSSILPEARQQRSSSLSCSQASSPGR